MHKLCFIDVETTGLDAKVNGIIQIAGQVVFGHNAEYDVIETFNFSVQPFPRDVVNQQALKVNGVTEADIQRFRKPGEVFFDLISTLNRHVEKNNFKDKFYFAAYNAAFDFGFIKEWFLKNNNSDFDKYFDRRILDVMQLAMFNLLPYEEVPNFKLSTVAEYLNINPDGQLHDALTDISLTSKIYFHFLNKNVLRG